MDSTTRCRSIWICALVTLSLLALLYTSTSHSNRNELYAKFPWASTRASTSLEQPREQLKNSSPRKSSPRESPRKPSPRESPSKLPKRVINGVRSVVLFIGHPRSGHSIVGSILDSHPHIVVSHELDLFNKMVDHPNWSKSEIFNAFWSLSIKSSTSGLRTDTKKANRKGYSLGIPDLYQGTYESYIDVIGDKRGGRMTELLKDSPRLWKKLYDRLKSVTGIPVKIFHVIRNPFDNIATSVLFASKRASETNESIVELKKDGHDYLFDHKLVDNQVTKYFKFYQAIEDAKVRFDLDVIEVHGKDLIADPKKVINEMCEFLQVTCDDDYLSVCSNKIFPEESKTRYQLQWKNYQIKYVQDTIKKFSNLHRYIEFDS